MRYTASLLENPLVYTHFGDILKRVYFLKINKITPPFCDIRETGGTNLITPGYAPLHIAIQRYPKYTTASIASANTPKQRGDRILFTAADMLKC